MDNRGTRKKLYRVVYDKMINLYSIFTITDYSRLVRFLLNEPEAIIPSDMVPSDYYDNLEDKWLYIMRSEFEGFLLDMDGYSKIVLVLTILEAIQHKSMSQNKIFLSMYDAYNITWWGNKPSSIKTVPNFYKVIITLDGRGRFYKAELIDGAILGESSRRKRVWNKGMALNYIDYGYLDDELFDLLYRDSFRGKLRDLIKVYIRAFEFGKH